jgi:hypothetical protein
MAPFTRKWRYLNGMVLSLQPKFIPGLYIGFTRGMQFYGTNLNVKDTIPFMDKYFPAVTDFFKGKINSQDNEPNKVDAKDQQASVFLRFVMPKSHFEVYFEYGYNDFKDNTRDLILDAQHSSAYLAGFKKLVELDEERYLSISGEVTQMSQSPDFVVRNAGNWYTHNVIFQGFSHMNQIMGAGSGLGNNVQTLHVEQVNGLQRLGFKVQRIQNDPRRIYGDVNNTWISPVQWRDISYGPTIHWRKQKLAITGELQFVHSRNYAWLDKNLFNVYSSINFIYKW